MLKSLRQGFNHKQKASVKLRRRYQMNFIMERASHDNKFLEDFWNTWHQNLKKLANFFKFQSISIHAIHRDGQQETVSVPSNSLQQQN